MDKPTTSRQGLLEIDNGHRLWWSEGGDPSGPAVLVIHGGPGGRSRPEPLSWLAGLPVRWVCWDQRGSGQSQPTGSLQGNTLSHLLADMQSLQGHLGLGRMALLAGSWGAVLALEFARAHPESVSGLMLRSAFLGSREEVEAFFAPWEAWLGEAGRRWLEAGRATHEGEERGGSLSRPGALALIDDTGKVPVRLAWAWERFEDAQALAGGVAGTGARFAPPDGWPPAEPAGSSADQAAWFSRVDRAALEIRAHYLLNDCFLPSDARARWARALREVPPGPVALVHGLSDATCDPASTAWLAALWPQARVARVPGAGHRMSDPRLAPALREMARHWVADLCVAHGSGA